MQAAGSSDFLVGWLWAEVQLLINWNRLSALDPFGQPAVEVGLCGEHGDYSSSQGLLKGAIG